MTQKNLLHRSFSYTAALQYGAEISYIGYSMDINSEHAIVT